MGFEVLDERIKFELRRFAAVFAVQEWGISREIHGFSLEHKSEVNAISHYVRIRENGVWLFFLIGAGETFSDVCRVSWYAGKWQCALANCAKHNELMGRGLYRLGFEDEGVLTQLPQLSAHEKLELRLSMPREFWPQTWLDEAGEK